MDTLFKMTISSSFLILIVMIIRHMFRYKIRTKTVLFLWYFCLCRLMIPIFIAPPELITPVLNEGINQGTLTAQFKGLSNFSQPAMRPESESKIMFLIWIFGFCVCLLHIIIPHCRAHRKYKQAIPVDINRLISINYSTWRNVQVKVTDQIRSPLTYGFLRPIILLPQYCLNLEQNQLHMVVSHEMIHIRQFDIIWKWLFLLALSLHWFNPLVWFMYRLAGQDIEYSCDEMVIKRVKNRREYAYTLLSLLERREAQCDLGLTNNDNDMEKRLIGIMSYKKTTPKQRITALSIILVFAILFCGTAFSASPKGPGKPIHSSIQNVTQRNAFEIEYGENYKDITIPVQQIFADDTYSLKENGEEIILSILIEGRKDGLMLNRVSEQGTDLFKMNELFIILFNNGTPEELNHMIFSSVNKECADFDQHTITFRFKSRD